MRGAVPLETAPEASYRGPEALRAVFAARDAPRLDPERIET